jgi:hypothetical protein
MRPRLAAPLGLAVGAIAGLGACGTVVPMQTASVVAPGVTRVSGQIGAAYCDFASTFRCNDFPDGVPLPALRLDGRRGVAPATDVGASAQLETMLYAPERPVGLGLTVDGKRELLRSGGGGRVAHVLSAGVLLGGAIAGRWGLAPWLRAEAGVPLFYGIQTAHYEFVLSGWTAYRALVPSVGGDQDLPTFHSLRFGGGLGVYRRAPAGWGASLGYDTSSDLVLGGAVQVRFGWFRDLGAPSPPPLVP